MDSVLRLLCWSLTTLLPGPRGIHIQKSSDGETIGMVGKVVLLVVHTWPDAGAGIGAGVGRIISARKATKLERKAYEEEQ